jgi:hypothetical protein
MATNDCLFSQVYRDLRKREIYRMADKIVEGKRRKFLTDKNNEIEKLLTDKNNESEKEQSQNSTSISESTSGILLTFVGPTWSKKACKEIIFVPKSLKCVGVGSRGGRAV